MKNILLLDKIREFEQFPGNVKRDTYTSFFDQLTGHIEYFVREETATIQKPLLNFNQMKSKYSDSIQMLAFAYASLYTQLIGNITWTTGRLKLNVNSDGLNFVRSGLLTEFQVETPLGTLQVENKFGILRFVSCGYKVIGDFPLNKFVSVFEISVWKWIAITYIALSISILLLVGKSWSFVCNSGALCFIKVVLEQGDPFPRSLNRIKRFRFVICGTLLAGL
jgi:hypothetical protein